MQLRHIIYFKFLDPIHISGMYEARVVKFSTLIGYGKSYQRDKKITPKERGYGHVTHLNF